MVLPVPGLKVGSGDYCKSVFTDGKNVVYSIYHSGLPNRFTEYRIIPWADLEHGVSQTISLEPGKAADLIVTAADPLADLRALRHVELVMSRGQLHRAPQVKHRKNVEAELDRFL